MAPALILATALAALLAAPPDDPRKVPADQFTPDPAWKPLDKKDHRPIWFDPAGKRVILRARVAVREGALEHLLCAVDTKEHESIVATDAPPKLIHLGLLLTGAEKGHPVRYRPKFEPPEGTPIAIELEWIEGGKPRRANALDWVKDSRSGKPPERGWVFAGSDEFTDPDTKQVHYAADGGDLFTVANFASAILDLPLASTPNDAERVFVANTPRIPPSGTYVTMILHPVKPLKP